MDVRGLTPFVRFASRAGRSSDYPVEVKAYDHRLFFVTGGETEFRVGGERIGLSPGMAIILPPAVGYRICFPSGAAEYIIVNFDVISGENRLITEPMTPVESGSFDEELVICRETLEAFDPFLAVECPRVTEQLLELICAELAGGGEYSAEIISSALRGLLLSLIRINKMSISEQSSRRLADRIRELIDADETGRLTNLELARRLGYHPQHLARVFRESFGISLHAYVTRRRVERVRELLMSSDASLAEIAERCGYCTPAYMTEQFTAFLGVTPSAYRRRRD